MEAQQQNSGGGDRLSAQLKSLLDPNSMACLDVPPAIRLVAVQQLLHQPLQQHQQEQEPAPDVPMGDAQAADDTAQQKKQAEIDLKLQQQGQALRQEFMELLRRLHVEPPQQQLLLQQPQQMAQLQPQARPQPQQQQQQLPQMLRQAASSQPGYTSEQQQTLQQLLQHYARGGGRGGGSSQQPAPPDQGTSLNSNSSGPTASLQDRSLAQQQLQLQQLQLQQQQLQYLQRQLHEVTAMQAEARPGGGRRRRGGSSSSSSSGGGGAGDKALAPHKLIGRRKPHWRPHHTIGALEQKVSELQSELQELGATQQQLRGLQGEFESKLSMREKEVEEWLLLKLQNPEPAQAGPPPPPAYLSVMLQAPSVFKDRVMDTVGGALPTPGTLPMFAPLPQDLLHRLAKVLATVRAEVDVLRRAAQRMPEEAGAVEAYLQRRLLQLMNVQHRFVLLNPIFMHQLRALNVETLQPVGPYPPGLWQRVARAMSVHISPNELQQLKTCYKLFVACKRNINKEQQQVQQQILHSCRRLQELTHPSSGGADAGGAGSRAGGGSAPPHNNAPRAAPPAAASGGTSPPLASTPKGGVQAGAGAGASAAPAAAASVRGASSSAPPPAAPPPPAPAAAPPASAGPAAFTASKLDSLTDWMQVLQVQQQLRDHLEQYELLLLREHDQHVLLMRSIATIPAKAGAVIIEMVMQSRPFTPNQDEVMRHLAEL